MTEIWPQFLNNEVNLGLRWFTVMRAVTELICSANHWMTEIIYNENQSSIFGLRNDDTVIVFEHSFLENKMCPSRWHNPI